MENYKEKYEILVNNIDELKNKREKLEEIFNNKKIEGKNLLIKESSLNAEIIELKEERNNIINKKTKPVITFTNTILLLLLIVAVYLEVKLALGAATVLNKILLGIGLFVGLGNIYAIALGAILLVRNWIIEKIKNKNKKEERCILLTKEIKNKNKSLSDIEKRKNIITEEQKQLKNSISETTEQIDLNTKELQQLKDEIINFVLTPPKEMVDNQANIINNNPYARVRTKEN